MYKYIYIERYCERASEFQSFVHTFIYECIYIYNILIIMHLSGYVFVPTDDTCFGA